MVDLVVRNARVVTEAGTYNGGFAVDDGKFVLLGGDMQLPKARREIDAGENYVLPGCIDAHVHIRYPGIPYRENFQSGSYAAASSGTTLIIEMPLSKPPTYTVEELYKRVECVKRQAIIDFAFYGAAGNKTENIEPLAQAGVVGYKTFLQRLPKGREEEYIGLDVADEYELYKAFQAVDRVGLPLGIHTENMKLLQGIISACRAAGQISREYHAKSRPVQAEILMVGTILDMGAEFSNPVYLTHLTNAHSIMRGVEAKRRGQRVIIESCPHYLYMTDQDIIEKGVFAVCNPPLRSKQLQDGLWECLKNGEIDIISSDHSPYTREEKLRGTDNIFDTVPGMPGLEVRVPFMLKAVKEGKISIEQAASVLSTNVAKAFGLYPRKGSIRIGSDADFVIVDMEKPYVMNHDGMYSCCKDAGVVYDGAELWGKAIATVVRGQTVFAEGKPQLVPGYGSFVKSNLSLGICSVGSGKS